MKQIKAKIYSLNEIDSRIVDRLNEINLKAKDGSAYHDFNLNKYVSNFFNFNTKVILSYNKSEDITGYFIITVDNSKLVNAIFSPRQETLITYGGPISIIGDPKELQTLLKTCENIYKLFLVYIKSVPNIDNKVYNIRNYNITKIPTLFLDLTKGQTFLWNNLDNRIRRNYKKANSYNLKLVVDKGERIEDFVRVYKDLCNRTGLTFHGIEYYKGLIKILGDKIIFFYAYLDIEVISVMAVLKHKNVINPWFGGTITEHLRTEAGTLVYWEIIKYGCNEGYKYFDFLGLDKEKIAFYKRGFGGFELPVYHLTKKNIISKIILKSIKWAG